MKVMYKGPLSIFSGYGNDGIGLVKALIAYGIDVRLNPTAINVPLPAEVAYLFTSGLEAPFDMVINHVDPYQLEVAEAEMKCADMRVGWTMWERTALPKKSPKTKSWRLRCKDMDALFAYDAVSAGAMQPVMDKLKVPVLKLQGGADFSDWKYFNDRDWDGPFRFIMVGQLHQRKDPFVAIQAFKELKDEKGAEFEDAELHLKTNIIGLHPKMEEWCPKLKIHYAVWDIGLMQQFYQGCHVLLAPSRGEGKNMPALEFMATGGTVIVTNWGGHTEWLSDDIGYPLDYQLLPNDNADPDALEARASKEHLKELMWHTFTHRYEAREKGRKAAEIIPKMCSWDSVLDRFFLQIGTLGDVGQHLHASAVSARTKAFVRET